MRKWPYLLHAERGHDFLGVDKLAEGSVPRLLFLIVEKVESALATGQPDHATVKQVKMGFVQLPSDEFQIGTEGAFAHSVMGQAGMVTETFLSRLSTGLSRHF